MKTRTGIVIGSIFAVTVITVLWIVLAKLERIEPGHVGVSVLKCKRDQQSDGVVNGVRTVPIGAGYYWRELVCEDVVEIPTTLRTLVLTKNPHEGPDNTHESDQSITVTSKESMPVGVDSTVSYIIDGQKAAAMYAKFRKPIEEIELAFMRQQIRLVLQDVTPHYTIEQLRSSKMEEWRLAVEKDLHERLAPEGFIVQNFTINDTPRVDDNVLKAINSKVEMMQQSQRADAEVAKKRAEADQAAAVADGEARATVARANAAALARRAQADAEAYYNHTVAASVSDALIRAEWVKKWDGHLSQVSGGAGGQMIQIPLSR